MKLTVKSEKRALFLETVIEFMKGNNIFSDYVSRDRDTAGQIQKSIFLELEENKLPGAIANSFRYSDKKSTEWVKNHFHWEKKTITTVNNFPFMATNHRPDAVLDLPDGCRVAIEIKKGYTGAEIRAGIGQAIVYATQFDFVLYLFVDTTDSRDILSASSGVKEQSLVKSLWDNYNIRFDVV